ncbi:MAG: thioredoxin domain-containing protein, partial [Chloroflexi bacterium]|nr:thioredoxin domain-containing protein [Chloroflexota bacterium]
MPTKKSPPAPAIEALEDDDDAVMQKSPEETLTFTFKVTHFYSVLVVLAFAVGVLVGYVAWGRNNVTTVVAQPSGEIAEAPQEPQYQRYEIPTDGYPSLGPKDAPIVIVEFSDYQCPYCRRFHDETY